MKRKQKCRYEQKHNFAVDKAHRCEYNLLSYQVSSCKVNTYLFTLLGEDFVYVRISIDDNDCYWSFYEKLKKVTSWLIFILLLIS